MGIDAGGATMPLILKVTEIPESEAGYARYSFRYTVSYFAMSDDAFGLWQNHLQYYAGTGAGQEDMVTERFKLGYPDAVLTGVWQE
jgi:hypothetical protein